MHNTSSVWTAVTKQTWTQKPSQANSLSSAQSRGGDGFVWGTWDLSAGERSQSSVYMCFIQCLHLLKLSLDKQDTGGEGRDVLGRKQWRYF